MGVDTGFTREDHHGPVWADPTEEYLPSTVQADAVIGESAKVTVFVSGFRVFPTGVSTRLSVRLRDGQDEAAGRQMINDVFDDSWTHFPSPSADTSRLTWWFEFSDGRSAYGVDDALREELHAAADAGAPAVPSRPVLVGGAGSGIGGPLSVERDFWLWPLPSPGVLRVHCAWSALGVAPTTVDLDADALRNAAGQARRLW
jgi:hypothetical protein